MVENPYPAWGSTSGFERQGLEQSNLIVSRHLEQGSGLR